MKGLWVYKSFMGRIIPLMYCMELINKTIPFRFIGRIIGTFLEFLRVTVQREWGIFDMKNDATLRADPGH